MPPCFFEAFVHRTLYCLKSISFLKHCVSKKVRAAEENPLRRGSLRQTATSAGKDKLKIISGSAGTAFLPASSAPEQEREAARVQRRRQAHPKRQARPESESCRNGTALQ